MNFYEELVYSEDNIEKTYRIRIANGNQYKFYKKEANLDWSKENQMLVFTDTDNNRVALNWLQIESVIEEI